ncbi:hypothetical protein AB2L27_17790 [Kineococcus sp. LSe6-4]|uniref:Uncharacterized protein n=1 Tax=Kineococcus halophytocola TaxID=3234027 RepID=A0ABV4H5P8_9ACTN
MVLVQPDGNLAVWSTGARTLLLRDATDQQVVEHLTARALADDGGTGDAVSGRRALRAARWAVGRARQGLQPRVQLPRWDDVAGTPGEHPGA